MKSSHIRDFIATLLLLVLGGYYLAYRGVFNSLPYEDAAILMRYIDNLANGFGIVWNPGETPIDGGTDFLFLVLAALLQKMGLSTENAVLSLNLFAYFATSFLIYIGWGRMGNARWLSFLAASLVLSGPAYAYIEAAFASPFFGFLTALVSLFALLYLRNPEEKAWSYGFGIASLFLGLCRPEGVFLSAFLWLGVRGYLGKGKSQHLLKSYAIWVLGIGSIYFLWHYVYFGHLFPNPFYKKGGGIYLLSFFESLSNAFKLLLPLFIAFLLNFLYKKEYKSAWLFLFPVLAFSGIWILLSNEMNYLMRFQYALLPMALLLLAYVLGKNSPRIWLPLKSRLIAVPIIAFTLIHYLSAFPSEGIQQDGRYEVGRILHDYKEKGYSIALSEAGLLPFYSGWRCLDSWGLNDHQIALDGVIQGDYLRDFGPDIIMYDKYESSAISGGNPIWESYGDMIDTLDQYIEEEAFELIAKFSSSNGDHAHYYYINPQIPDAASLIDKIRISSYYWYESGQSSKAEF